MTNHEYIRKQPCDDAVKILHAALKKHGEHGIKEWLGKQRNERKRKICQNFGEKS